MNTVEGNNAQFQEGGSVTYWLNLLKHGEKNAITPLWGKFYDRMSRHADAKLPPMAKVAGEDLAAIAFNSFFFLALDQKYNKLDDRGDLWRLLVTILDRKVSDAIKDNKALKRAGKLQPLSDSASSATTPDMSALVDEEFERLLSKLDKDDLREVALLRLEGYTIEEIAAKVGRAKRTVDMKLSLIKKILNPEARP